MKFLTCVSCIYAKPWLNALQKKLQDGSLREMYGGVSVPVFVFLVHMCHN